MEPQQLNDFERELEIRGIFFSFAVHFTAFHKVDKDFEVTDKVLDEFKDFLKDKKVDLKEEDWNEENIEYVKDSIKREVFRKLFGVKGAYLATLPHDEEVQKVLDMFRKAPTLKDMFEYIAGVKQQKKDAE